jgi:hypothetical protein
MAETAVTSVDEGSRSVPCRGQAAGKTVYARIRRIGNHNTDPAS